MKVFLISLGCDKNLCDSENMLGMLARSGYEITDDEAEAGIIIVKHPAAVTCECRAHQQ